jgi:hypothetical protein
MVVAIRYRKSYNLTPDDNNSNQLFLFSLFRIARLIKIHLLFELDLRDWIEIYYR